MYESAWARAFQSSCQLPSLGRLAPPGPVKLPSRTPSGARALVSCQPPPAARPLIPSSPLSQELAPLHRRGFGEYTKARGGSKRHWELSWRLLGQRAGQAANQPAEPAGTALELPPVVAKCSVMVGEELSSRRRLFGCSGPKSGSAGSSWRPQPTQISAAPQTRTPVLQDKPRHSTDLAELCSLILWSALFPFRS